MRQCMARQFVRGVLIGLTILVGPISFGAVAQDYVDVEAERATETRAAPTTAGAVSYGVGSAPPARTRTLPPPAAPSGENVGVLFNQVQQLQQEVMRLNGVVEQLTYEVGQLKEQSLERYLDIDRRLSTGAVTGGSTGPGVAPGVGPGSTGGTDTSGRPTEAQEQPGEGDAYRGAYALVRGQEFDAAVSAFKAFLDRFPDGRYAPNAHYWLGELYLVQDPPDPEAARQSFTLLLDQYPDNGKVPDALYKLGRVYFMKGNSDRAREFLSRTMREHPDSSAARLASDFLDQNF